MATRSRWIPLYVLAVAALAVLGCEKLSQRAAQVETPEMPAYPMQVNETAYFEFPVDGQWHNSGIQVLYDDLLMIEMHGLTDGLTYGTVECRAGGPAIWVDGDEPVRFLHYAPLEFRVNARKSAGFPKPAEVKITKLADRRS